MGLNRRSVLKGAGITGAGVAATLIVGAQAAWSAAIYGSRGAVILRSGKPVATALSPTVAANLAANLNSATPPASAYRVSNGRGIYRVSQSRVVATAIDSTTASQLVGVLSNKVGALPGAPVLAAPIVSAPGQVQLNWTAPASDGGSPIIGYNVYIDGIKQ